MDKEGKQMLIRGLSSFPKYIPTWYNYDETGSKLHQILATENPNYYFTNCQLSALQQNIQSIVPCVPHELTLIDLGCGNCSKTKHIIDELLKKQGQISFYPVDISKEFLLKSVKELSDEYGDLLVVHPIAADYIQGIKQLRQVEGAKLIMWMGSILNLSYEDQVTILMMISTIMTDKCRLVFSTDVTQDQAVILKAYNNTGPSRMFIENAITRLNKEEGSRIDPRRFTYEVDFISDTNPHSISYVRTYFQAKQEIRYPIPGLGIDLVMNKGERLYFHEGDGFSCKYTLDQLRNIVKKARLNLEDTWTDAKNQAIFCLCTTK